MKPFSIALIATSANLLLVSGILILTDVRITENPGSTNWIALVAIGLAYALLVAAIGWLMGSMVNGLLVYPKRKTRNLAISQLNIGLIFLVAILAFWWTFLGQKALYPYVLTQISQYLHT